MRPVKTAFVCQSCGAQARKWLGRCPECGAWNTLREFATPPPAGRQHRRRKCCAAAVPNPAKRV